MNRMHFAYTKPFRRPSSLLLYLGAVIFFVAPLHAQDDTEEEIESPWLFAPIVSSDPKMGTSMGLIGGYIHRFDEQSNPSLFTLFGSYSDTDSHVIGIAADTYFSANQHKLVSGFISGRIHNDYDDFLGTGANVITEDNLDLQFLRYSYRVAPNWYLGGQAISSNYAIGADGIAGKVLDMVGLTGFDSTGIGVIVEYDSRDNVRNATRGSKFIAHNVAYRESLGGDESFDVYRADYTHFRPFGDGHVFAIQASGRWTDSAPRSGYSSVNLRGYTKGNYLAKRYSHIDMEGRFEMAKRWYAAAFAGVGCLYNSASDCSDSEEIYPSAGAGVFYLLKPQSGFVIRADYAKGKSDNSAFYLTLGQPF